MQLAVQRCKLEDCSIVENINQEVVGNIEQNFLVLSVSEQEQALLHPARGGASPAKRDSLVAVYTFSQKS